jgi:hypothetical protein
VNPSATQVRQFATEAGILPTVTRRRWFGRRG